MKMPTNVKPIAGFCPTYSCRGRSRFAAPARLPQRLPGPDGLCASCCTRAPAEVIVRHSVGGGPDRKARPSRPSPYLHHCIRLAPRSTQPHSLAGTFHTRTDGALVSTGLWRPRSPTRMPHAGEQNSRFYEGSGPKRVDQTTLNCSPGCVIQYSSRGPQ